jgi:hypothetical protein
MDPWLEASGLFPDVHDSLIYLIREALNAGLPDGYLATFSHLVWVDPELTREPDVGTYGPGERPTGDVADGPFASVGMVTVVAAPVTEPREEPYLEIRTADDERLVTAVEILSPSNKAGGSKGRLAYLQKQEELQLGGVHLVEIDLLRGGAHTTGIGLPALRRLVGEFDYHLCVTVCGDPTRHHVRGIRLADRLPPIVVPLDPGVPPVTVELQPLLDRAYDTGRYARRARYARPCDPPLSPEQQAWADGVLRAKGVIRD